MKLLYQDRTTSVSAGATLTGFSADNVKDDRPRNAWIGATRVNNTFTLVFNASANYPIDAFFLHGLLADEVTWQVYDATTGGSVVESGTLDTAFPLQSDIGQNANTGNVYFNNQTQLLRSYHVQLASPVTQAGRLVLTMSANEAVQNETISGAVVSSWIKDSDDGTYSYGRLLDSGATAINIIENGRIFVGSYLAATAIDSNVTTDTTISADVSAITPLEVFDNVTLTIADTYTLTITENVTSGQIVSITGDGTASGAIQLEDVIESGDVAQVYNPIRLGIARAGKVLDLPNPQSASWQVVDYSIRRPGPTGGYSNQPKGVARVLNLSLILTNAQRKDLEDLYRAYRSKPIPVQWIEDMPSDFEEETRANVFGFFVNPPAFNQLNRTHCTAQLTLQEVI